MEKARGGGGGEGDSDTYLKENCVEIIILG